MIIPETRYTVTVANILSFMTPKIPDPWTCYLQGLVECSAAPAPSSVVNCGANFTVEDVVHNNKVQGNVFWYLGQVSNTDLFLFYLLKGFLFGLIEGKGKLKLFLSRFI